MIEIERKFRGIEVSTMPTGQNKSVHPSGG
jgi:hypothetical protein